jgi:hypothetical protein
MLPVRILLAVALGISSMAHAADSPVLPVKKLVPTGYYARLRPEKGDTRIPGLTFVNGDEAKVVSRIVVNPKTKKRMLELWAIALGQLETRGWNLVWDEKDSAPIDASPDTGFIRAVRVKGHSSAFHLTAVGPKGEAVTETWTVSFDDFSAAVQTARSGRPPARFSWSGGLGVSSISYLQTSVPDFSQLGLTAKVGVNYRFVPSRWDLGLSTYLTALPLSSNLAGTKARFVGVNFRVGYATPWLRGPWHLSLQAGGYYASMFVSGSEFGYRNLSGPQVFPAITRTLARGDLLQGYFKFSPVTDGTQLLSLSNRELAVGASYVQVTRAKRHLVYSLDWSQLHFGTSGSEISSTSISLGLGYGW